MSALRPPRCGPIVGHTTEKSCRLWIQAGDPEDDGATLSSTRRTVGVIGLFPTKPSKGKPGLIKGYYFRLMREFDRTGTFVLGEDVALGQHESDGVPAAQRDTPYELTPDTTYRVRLGTLSLDDPMPDDEVLSDVELAKRLPPIKNMAPLLLDLPAETCEAVFRTFPDPARQQDNLTFLLGSCRYPGLMWKVKEADQIFDPMYDHLSEGKQGAAARFVLMVGDQIYADTLNRFVPIGRADTYAEFQERYQTALASPNMRRMLRTTASYMILDDHEIEDNWTQDRLGDRGKHELFNLAIGAYMSYQWSHGPRTYGRLLYYRFECGGYPFFVLDLRTQRFKDEEPGLRDNHMLGRPAIDPVHRGQLQTFLDWLSEQQKLRGDAPKFVGSSSVFAPNAMDERIEDDAGDPEALLFAANQKRRADSDSWPAYPATRKAILDHIVANRIQNVVFLTGDIHCSNIASMALEQAGKDSGLRAYDITSSAFYWPFPFADGDPNNYVHDSTKPEQRDSFPIAGGRMTYRAWGFTQEDNFCRVDIDKPNHALQVRYFDRKGAPIEVADERGNRSHLQTLPLAAWG